MSNHRSWKSAIHDKGFVIQLVVSVIVLLSIILYLPHYFHNIIGPKPGWQLEDPILSLFTPVDSSGVIFTLIYLSLFIVLFGLVKKPYQIAAGISSYLLITVFRMITMYMFTLEPPTGIIVLQDPFIDRLAYGGNAFTKDLFFSGHVATLTLLALLEERPRVKKVIWLCMALVAGLILIQRVHYTIDVLAAPLITYGIVKGLKYFPKSANRLPGG